MTDNEMDSGFELVLDNRRLIGAFAIFVVICGAFFVIGYTTGKRQGGIGAPEPVAAEAPVSPSGADHAAIGEPAASQDEPGKDLEWYQSVSDGEGEPLDITPPRASPSVAAEKASPASVNTAYSVQVGAFSTRERAEAHAADVRSKGFDSRVEEPANPGGLFCVRVGRYGTKPEAMQAQLQLKKNGFEATIKTN
jgi:cell division protein FtsN